MWTKAAAACAAAFIMTGCYETYLESTETPPPEARLAASSGMLRERMALAPEPAETLPPDPVGGTPVAEVQLTLIRHTTVCFWDGGPTLVPREWFAGAEERNDLAHWNGFQDYLRGRPEHFQQWRMDLQRRIRIRLVNERTQPLPDVDVILYRNGRPVYSARTVADGSTTYFPRPDEDGGYWSLGMTYHGALHRVRLDLLPEDDQTWDITLSTAFVGRRRPVVEAAFVLDATGSMGDELTYLQQDLRHVLARAFEGLEVDLRIGFVFYRDRGDAFITATDPFSADLETAASRLITIRPEGGGDAPEAVNQGLREALQGLSWSERDAVRLCFLLADGPPRRFADERYRHAEAAAEAAARGIKIIPVAANGIDPSAEYLYRMLAARTQGRYIHVTDDAGFGYTRPAEAPYPDGTLNAVLVRTLRDELSQWPHLILH